MTKKDYVAELREMEKYAGKTAQHVSLPEIRKIMRHEDCDIVAETYDTIMLYVYRGEPWMSPDVVVWRE